MHVMNPNEIQFLRRESDFAVVACAIGRRLSCVGLALLAATLVACQGPETIRSPDGSTEAPTPASVEALDERLATANSARTSGNYAEALELFREILAENPTAAQAYLGIGEIQVAQGNYGEAEPAFAKAARLEPRNFAAQYGHGRVLHELKRFLEAIRAYHRALSIQPDNFEANVNMAATYLEIDEAASALLYAEKAVQVNPSDGSARVALGTAYARLGRTRDAIEQFETALELSDPTSELLFGLIKAYGDERRYEEAANTATVLVRIAPSADAYERLGWSLFRLGRYNESIVAYRDAVRIDETHWPSLNGIGVNALNAWLLSNRTDNAASSEAREAFRRSLRVNGDQPKVVRLLTTYQL